MSRPVVVFISVIMAAATGITGCSVLPSDPLAIPDSPDGTVRVVIDGVAAHHPEVVWRALPPSYRADVNRLALVFAENMDPAVFDRSVAVSRKAAVVLQSKKELILSTETVRSSGVDIETVDAVWESVIHTINVLLASDLARLETYPTLDVESLLATTGAQLVEHAGAIPGLIGESGTLGDRLAELENSTVELVSERGDEAVVRISLPDAEPVEIAMTRIEDRWLPRELVRSWPGAVERAEARLQLLGSEEAARVKVQVLFAIGIAEGFIDEIDQMEVPEDLDNLIGGLLGSLVQVTEAAGVR